MSAVQPEPWFSVTEVAQAWGVSKNTVYDFIADGDLGHINVGRGRVRTRIPAAAITAFAEKRGENLPLPQRTPKQPAAKAA